MSGTSPIAAFLASDAPSPPHGGAWALPLPRRGRAPRIASWFGRVVAALSAAWRRQRSRARIAGLDAGLLKDIGVTFAEAEHEANKPFWRG
ncbi:MAG: DUF1127 domain-containing protein [Rhodospirillales bacterium]|jgi:uncharacterized protein YjiS (DUF1127 family)|nr:DUF1127 domain-containing protein [Rhodospirillales bacterium]